MQLTSIFVRNCSFSTPETKLGEKMKTPKVFCAATLLVLSLSIPVFAEGTNPGDVHEPGLASCICETPTNEESTGSTMFTIAGDDDFSLSAVVDMLWTAIF